MATRYIVTSDPLFSSGPIGKDPTRIEVLFGQEGEFVRVRTPGHGERVAISTEQGVRFLDAMEALRPEELPDVVDTPPGEMDFLDGWTLRGRIQKDDGTRHTFAVRTRYLPREYAARQWAFFSLVLRLAREVVRLPETVQWMKHFWMMADLDEPAAPSAHQP